MKVCPPSWVKVQEPVGVTWQSMPWEGNLAKQTNFTLNVSWMSTNYLPAHGNGLIIKWLWSQAEVPLKILNRKCGLGRSNQNRRQEVGAPEEPAEYQPWAWVTWVRQSQLPMNFAAGQFLFSAGKQSVSIFVKHFVICGELFFHNWGVVSCFLLSSK